MKKYNFNGYTLIELVVVIALSLIHIQMCIRDRVIGKQYLTNDSSSYYEDGGDFKYFDIADPNTDKDGNPLPVTRPIVEEVP